MICSLRIYLCISDLPQGKTEICRDLSAISFQKNCVCCGGKHEFSDVVVLHGCNYMLLKPLPY